MVPQTGIEPATYSLRMSKPYTSHNLTKPYKLLYNKVFLTNQSSCSNLIKIDYL